MRIYITVESMFVGSRSSIYLDQVLARINQVLTRMLVKYSPSMTTLITSCITTVSLIFLLFYDFLFFKQNHGRIDRGRETN